MATTITTPYDPLRQQNIMLGPADYIANATGMQMNEAHDFVRRLLDQLIGGGSGYSTASNTTSNFPLTYADTLNRAGGFGTQIEQPSQQAFDLALKNVLPLAAQEGQAQAAQSGFAPGSRILDVMAQRELGPIRAGLWGQATAGPTSGIAGLTQANQMARNQELSDNRQANKQALALLLSQLFGGGQMLNVGSGDGRSSTNYQPSMGGGGGDDGKGKGAPSEVNPFAPGGFFWNQEQQAAASAKWAQDTNNALRQQQSRGINTDVFSGADNRPYDRKLGG